MKLNEISELPPIAFDIIQQKLAAGETVKLSRGTYAETVSNVSASVRFGNLFIDFFVGKNHKRIGVNAARMAHCTISKVVSGKKYYWIVTPPEKTPSEVSEAKSMRMTDSEIPILYTLIRKWISQEIVVNFISNGLEGIIVKLEVDKVNGRAVFGHFKEFRMEYRVFSDSRMSKKRNISPGIEHSWFYPAELEDAKIISRDKGSVTIDIPDYLNHPEKLRDRK